MSKSYNNTIALRDDPKDIEQKLRTMPTDPARIRRTDPGDPEKCPVWELHKIYSTDEILEWVKQGCKSANIGCVDCKQPIIDEVLKELEPVQIRAKEYINNPNLVKNILNEGREAARDEAKDTLVEVRQAMGLDYR